ncbi:MAG: insulinase family protein, partial [Flavobacteriales bacterium]
MRSTLLAIALLAGGGALAQAGSYSYQSVPGDPLGARIYTLKNGLQVWMSRNPDAPRIQTCIAVAAGSKHDPPDATGLAHYLEHMLFKGTSRIGTSDWPREQALLQQISDAYEERRSTADEAMRERLYRRIDSLSQLAARHAIPNEYDKMVKSLGARGTNAYTSTERTVYVNDIPSDELERWMAIESERMQECVLRLFHTELETVYEEFNRGQDNDTWQAWEKLAALLYPAHPYGTQTTIGTGEHLKNPSMVRIHEYFGRYYVPNNMAVVLAGDIDYDKAIALADRYFGGWAPKPVAPFTFVDAPAAGGKAEVVGPEGEFVILAWRFPGYSPKMDAALELASGLLTNGTAGIIDLDLVQQQRVLEASAYSDVNADYSELVLFGRPREGQSLEEVRDLLLDCMRKVAEGDYDPWLLKAVASNLRLRALRQLDEHNWARANEMVDAFILKKDWKDVAGRYDYMESLTPDNLAMLLGKVSPEPHATVFKRTGPATGRHKVQKPPITPVAIEREGISEWRQRWEQLPRAKLDPQFIDFSSAVARERVTDGLRLAAVKNPTNGLFTLRFLWEMGTNHDRHIGMALDYLDYLGTSRLSPIDLKKELFRLGLSLTARADEDRSFITLSGLDDNLPAGLELLGQLLTDAQADKEAFGNLQSDILRQKRDGMKEKSTLLFEGLLAMGRYGAVNPLNDGLNEEALAIADPAGCIGLIRQLTEHPHEALYDGKRPAAEV